ncbi:hypothetical protein B0T25DRAFT_513688 [Lasiosphaeria hispida]|uniref:Uncharacterized protein n=1 Tax=Lasiosphaeria hispida TaxID=260671 RepID=A0AAJ0MKN0_9PEZI|nr:hypothetical protein B0T25DRAFT_513688 [Lasiosphaeria hispida]
MGQDGIPINFEAQVSSELGADARDAPLYQQPPPYTFDGPVQQPLADTTNAIPLNWKNILEEYFHELDVLRLDWASEIIARYQNGDANTRSPSTIQYIWDIMTAELSIRAGWGKWTWMNKCQFRFMITEGCFYETLPRSYGSLQTEYKNRKRAIDKNHPPQHFLTKSGLVAEPEPRVRHSEHLPEPRIA